MDADARMTEIMRASYGRLLAILSSRSRDILLAEDALSDAFSKALIHWPSEMPRNPEAWLLTVARNRLTDMARRDARIEFHDEVPGAHAPPPPVDGFPDERLKLMFVCAHPAIDTRIHAPLMLQTVLGLDAKLIAQAFVLPEATMAKRLVRAKRKIRDAGIDFQIPRPDELEPRVAAVLEAIYGAFSRDWLEPGELAEEALYLATLMTRLMPNNAEVFGLAALITFTLSRENARVQDGSFVPLEDHDMTLWDRDLLRLGRGYLEQAQAHGDFGRFQLEAAIQAVHADRMSTGATNWDALVQLHLGLSRIAPTLGATVGYAAALGKAVGPEAGLDVLNALDAKLCAAFAPAMATRAHLLHELGQAKQAADAYDRAIALTTEPPLKRYLQERRAALAISLD